MCAQTVAVLHTGAQEKPRGTKYGSIFIGTHLFYFAHSRHAINDLQGRQHVFNSSPQNDTRSLSTVEDVSSINGSKIPYSLISC